MLGGLLSSDLAPATQVQIPPPHPIMTPDNWIVVIGIAVLCLFWLTCGRRKNN